MPRNLETSTWLACWCSVTEPSAAGIIKFPRDEAVGSRWGVGTTWKHNAAPRSVWYGRTGSGEFAMPCMLGEPDWAIGIWNLFLDG